MGLAPAGMVIQMSEKESLKDNSEDNDDWMSYANAGFGTTDYSLWDDDTEAAELLPEPEFDDIQLDTGEEEIPAAPKPAAFLIIIFAPYCMASTNTS